MNRKAAYGVITAIALATAQDQTSKRTLDNTEWDRVKRAPYSEAVLHRDSPQRLFAERESKLRNAKTNPEKLLLVPRVAKAALEAGELEKAEKYATMALELAASAEASERETRTLPSGTKVSDTGEAVFYGHLVLGRLRILADDTEGAKAQLLMAGKTGGSPVLSNFGPNMSLANELLLRSEREAVIEFIKECKVFWGRDRGKLDEWLAEVSRGRLPDFEVNLFN